MDDGMTKSNRDVLRDLFEPDKYLHLGGRSFYFFDFDDNIAHLTSRTFVFHKRTRQSLELLSADVPRVFPLLGKEGTPFEDYEIDWDPKTGSFQNFRDHSLEDLALLGRKDQAFVEDIQEVVKRVEASWRGPSWDYFHHATLNQRPVSIITARGHNPETIKKGIKIWVEHEHLPFEPNYLTVLPVHHPPTREWLTLEKKTESTPELKKLAIRKSVDEAFKTYGFNEHHQFGMSEDDPNNLELIFEEMHQLKRDYPKNQFFVFATHQGRFDRHEISI